MTDKTCLICGSANPEDAGRCLFCGAPLTAQDQSGIPAVPADENDIPEWLRRVRERSQAEQESGEDFPAWTTDESEEEGALPDWLSSGDAVGESAAEPGAGSDWLKNLRSWQSGAEDQPEGQEPEPPAFEAAEPKAVGPEEVPDWLKALDELPVVPDKEPEIKPTEAAGEDQIPHWMRAYADDEMVAPIEPAGAEAADWLQKIENVAEPPKTVGTVPLSGKAIDSPDWLKAFAEETPAPEAAVSAEMPVEGETPDWLKTFAEETPAPEAAVSAEMPVEGETPDWLKTFAEETPAPEAAVSAEMPVEGETPDWLKTFAEETPAQEAAVSAEMPVEGETPDWLKAFTEETPAPEAAVSTELPVEGETPDWLKAFAEPETNLQAPTAGPMDLDWLQSFATETPQAASELAAKPGENPDGLKDFSTGTGYSQAEPKPVVPGEVPDWLNAFEEEKPLAAEIGNPPAEKPLEIKISGTPSIEPPAVLAEHEAGSGEEDLEWLADIRASEGSAGETAVLADWLSNEETTSDAFTLAAETTVPEAEGAQPFTMPVDMPQARLEQAAGSGEQKTPVDHEPAGEEPEALPQGELPGWLEAMRPVEAVVTEISKPVSEKRVERTGPLAGYQGVLPAEDLYGFYQRPPVYSGKLRLSEKQRVHVALLEGMVAEASQPRPLSPEKQISSQRIGRILTGLVFLLVLLIPLLTGIPAAALPPEGGALQAGGVTTVIAALAADAPVLVAADFQAAYAGEMRYAASGLLESLMARGQPLVVVSSMAAGPVLAEDLLRNAHQRLLEANPSAGQNYSLADRTTNLGYLPGGMTSLQEFSLQPRRAAPGYSDGMGWDIPWLAPVNAVSDFGAVIVLTDSVKSGRAWIEQVKPGMKDTPLLIVSSAQAAPLLAAYVHAGQVNGLVAGMAGGAAYDRTAGFPGRLNEWSAYQVGIFTAVIFLLAGALLQGAAGALGRMKIKRKP